MFSRTIVAAVCCLALAGCKDVLDLKNLEAVNQGDVWNDAKLAQAYVNSIYADNLPDWSTGNAGNSDEAPGGSGYMYGQLTESSVSYWPYSNIRRMNILLSEIDKGTIDKPTVQKLKGETYFFRAFRYWEMVKRYGGVPLVLRPQALTDSLLVSRNSTTECITQILADLDSAVALLPTIAAGSGANDGHVHKGTALALKGRVLLFYASPQFNRTDDRARWQNAYDANVAARDYLSANGFGLYPDFANLWFVDMNREDIFVQRYYYAAGSSSSNTQGDHWEASTRPLDESQGSTGGNRPTLEMVKAFPMKDGRPIANNPAYDSVYFWKNRDPRFKATIAYNGSVWELSAKSGRRQWTYSGGESNNPTPTGFYTRKAVNTKNDAFAAYNGTTTWVEIRYAEVLMNLAEAANALGKTQEAYDQLILLRTRAGIDAGNGLYGLDSGMGRAQLQDAIMRERQVEFAFEDKRYWDLRRNMLFEKLLNGTRRHGVKISLKIPAAQWLAIRDTVNLDATYAQYFKTDVIDQDTKFTINWQPNYYFYAIPPSQLQLNSNLLQTNGWAAGAFDPLK